MTSDARNQTAITPGTIGIWQFADRIDARVAGAVENAGFASIWLGGGPSPTLRDADRILRSTQRIQVATGIVVIWRASPREMRDSWSAMEDRWGDRFLLGLGTGHQTRIGPHAEPPFSAMRRYLDELESVGVPLRRLVIAALGPRMLQLAAERTGGAHPYLVDPSFVKHARDIVGPALALVPEQRVVLGHDLAAARREARNSLAMYLGLPNYLHNFARSGFSASDTTLPGSDRLVDGLAAYEADGSIRSRVAEHLKSGADQVVLQLVGRAASTANGYLELARAAGLTM